MSIHVRLPSAEPHSDMSALADLLFPKEPCSHTRFYPAGSEIYGQGEPAGSLYLVEFGSVRLYRLLEDGRRQISAFHVSGEVFGFEADAEHHFFAEAIGATKVRILKSCSGQDAAILPLALKSLVRAQEHLLVLGRQSAAERISAFLLDMADRQGGLECFELPMSRTDIADYLGMTIETVSRLLSKLKQKGTIRLPTLRTVEIVNWFALRAAAV